MKLSIVTPAFNRHEFLNQTISSVVTQVGNFDLEYIIQNGGTDGRVSEILNDWLSAIESGQFQPRCNSLSFQVYAESDQGMYDAINKGFEKCSGEILAWINSDDLYFQGALDTVHQIFRDNSELDWLIGRSAVVNSTDAITYVDSDQKALAREFVRQGYYRADVPYFNWLPQDSNFWRSSLWIDAGPLDTSFRLVSDFKLWQAFSEHSQPVKVNSLLGAFRHHGNQLTGNPQAYTDELGPPPKLPKGLKFACGIAWICPRLATDPQRMPGGRLVRRLTGLNRKELFGQMCY